MNKALNFLLYILGVFFILAAIGFLSSDEVLSGIFCLIFGLLLFPIIYKKVLESFPKIKKKYYIIFTIFILFLSIGMIRGEDGLNDESKENVKNATETEDNQEARSKNDAKERLKTLLELSKKEILNGDSQSIKNRISINKTFIDNHSELEDLKSLSDITVNLEDLLKIVEKEEATKWEYTESKDQITDELNKTAYLVSENKISQTFPYTDSAATLFISKKGNTKSMGLILDSGQFLTYGKTAALRFDDKTAFSVELSGASDYDSKYAFFSNVDKIIGEIQKSEKLKVQIDLYQNGGVIFEFDIIGLEF